MKVNYDSTVDAAFITLSNQKPSGATEIDEDIIVHVTEQNSIVAIEILGASKRFSLDELFKFEIENYKVAV